MNNLIANLGGKKMVGLIGFILITIFKDKLGLDEATYTKLSQTLAVYFVGQGVADGLSKGETSHIK